MDAFSVSLANGLHEPKMKLPRMLLIAGTFAIFQGVMPMLGWICALCLGALCLFFERQKHSANKSFLIKKLCL
jgi:putative Mn2+ efflux pump MntP